MENEAPFADGTVLVEVMDKEFHLETKVFDKIIYENGKWRLPLELLHIRATMRW